MSQPDYRLNDPGGWCGNPRRGAAMGRPTFKAHDAEFTGQIHIRRIRINSGGYDPIGTYFGDPGNGDALYWVATVDGKIDYVQWAPGRATVEAAVRERWPWAKVMRSSFSGERWRLMRQPGHPSVVRTSAVV